MLYPLKFIFFPPRQVLMPKLYATSLQLVIATVEYYNRSLTYTYTADPTSGAQVITVTDDFGNNLVANTGSNGLLNDVTGPAGNVYVFEHDANDSLSTIYFPDNTPGTLTDNPKRLFHYEETLYPSWLSKYLLSAITDERGIRYVEWIYSSGTYPRFRATSSQRTGEGSYAVGGNNQNTVTITNRLGKETVYHYATVQGSRKLVQVEGIASDYCVGTQKSFTYDTSGFIEQSTDQNGNTTTFERDALGRVTSKTQASGTAQSRTTTTQWHPLWSKPSQVVAPGLRTDYTFDSNGNRATKTLTDTASGQTRITTYTHDQFGQLLSVDGPRTDVNDSLQITYYNCQNGNECGKKHTVSNSKGHTTTYATYDGYGNPLTVTDANGITTTLTYDSRQRLLIRLLVCPLVRQ